MAPFFIMQIYSKLCQYTGGYVEFFNRIFKIIYFLVLPFLDIWIKR